MGETDLLSLSLIVAVTPAAFCFRLLCSSSAPTSLSRVCSCLFHSRALMRMRATARSSVAKTLRLVLAVVGLLVPGDGLPSCCLRLMRRASGDLIPSCLWICVRMRRSALLLFVVKKKTS